MKYLALQKIVTWMILIKIFSILQYDKKKFNNISIENSTFDADIFKPHFRKRGYVKLYTWHGKK